MDRIFVIAEAGVNHNGDMKIARSLVDVAKCAGADAVKFQTFNAEKLVTKTAPKAGYQIDNTGYNGAQFAMLKQLELPPDTYSELMSYCKEKEIIFLSTPFDESSADMLNGIGMSIFKIPSGEITNRSLLRHIASMGKDIILSTGMSYLGEVEKAIQWIHEIWNQSKTKPRLTLLQCVSNYPALLKDINLRAMKTMEAAFGLPVGYSDHTMGTEISIAAAAMGARVIEKHFTLDRSMKGPDHTASLEPDELKNMIAAIRNVQTALGNGIKRPAGRERDNREVVRKSLVAKKEIRPGETIMADDITVKRPGTGISPVFKEDVVGMEAKRNIDADSTITWDDLKSA